MIVVAECFAQNEHAESGPRVLHVLSVIDSVIMRRCCDDNIVSLRQGLHCSHRLFLQVR